MGIKTLRYSPFSRNLASCDFLLFPKLRGCRYETIEEKKEAVTKVIDMLTQEDFQKLLKRYNKSIAAGGDYFEGDSRFMCVLSIKVPLRKKSGNLLYAPRKQRGVELFGSRKCIGHDMRLLRREYRKKNPSKLMENESDRCIHHYWLA